MKKYNYFLHAAVLTVLLLIDQYTKHLARTHLKLKAVSLIPDFFSFTYHENRGSVWGILQGKIPFFLFLSVFLFMALLYVYVRMPKTKTYLPLLWIIVIMAAGAVGNTIDRLFFGFVTDFLYFEWINFPIFNVADCYITISAFLTIILMFTLYRNDEFTFLNLRRKERPNGKNESDKN